MNRVKKLKKDKIGVFVKENGKVSLKYMKIEMLTNETPNLWIIHPKVNEICENEDQFSPMILLEPIGENKIYHFKDCHIKNIHVIIYDHKNKSI